VEAELLVVIGADELGGVDGALLERRIDVAAGDLLWRHADLAHHLAREAGDAHLQALQVVDRVDFLAEPAAHLGAGVAEQDGVNVVAGEEFVQQLVAAGLVEPGIRLARIEAEGNRGAEREGRVLADIVIGAGMGHLDRARGDGIGRLQRRNDFAAGKMLDREVAAGRFPDMVGDDLAGTEQDVEALGEGGGHAPGDLRVFLRDGGRCKGRRGRDADAGSAGLTDKCSAVHGRHAFLNGCTALAVTAAF